MLRLLLQTNLLIGFLLSLSMSGNSQKKSLYFDVIRNAKTVGKIIFSETSSGKNDSLKLEVNVKTKLIWTFNAEAREMAVFRDGILFESSIYRKVNGDEKANKKQRVDNGKYIITHGLHSKEMSIYPITYTMLSLYSKEPVNLNNVYSDNFESLVGIQKIEDHKYKVTLPDNNYNSYFYKDGLLSHVEIHHTMYSAKFVLVAHTN